MRPAVKIILAPLAFRGRRRKRAFFNCERLFGQSQGRTIWIDPRLGEPAQTLYHELLHVQHPDWDEDRVRAHEALRWPKLTWQEKGRLLQLFGRALLEGEEDQGSGR